MKNFFLTLHILSMCLVVGTLFLQSLIVVFRLRLKKQEEITGVKNSDDHDGGDVIDDGNRGEKNFQCHGDA